MNFEGTELAGDWRCVANWLCVRDWCLLLRCNID